MAKIYPSNPFLKKTLKPREETLRFLMDFSKSYRFISTRFIDCEVVIN